MVDGRLSVRVRVLAALAAIAALNALFVAVVTWLYLVLLPTIVGGGYLYYTQGVGLALWDVLRLPFSPAVLAAITVAFLGGQIYYGYTRVLSEVRTGTVEPAEYPRLHGLVGRLAASADVPKPAVAVVDAETPNSFTIGGGRSATIVVTEPLLDVLDEAELETVLAHEIAHVRHRDVTLMTVTGLFVAIADRTLRTARLLRRGVTDWDQLSRRQQLALDWLLPIVLFTYVVAAPVLWLFPPVARFASGELSRQREYAADRAAAELTGSPTTLARALIEVHESTPDVAQTDLRRERAGLQALCVVPYGVVDVDPAGVETASTGAERTDATGAASADGGSAEGTPTRAAEGTATRDAKQPAARDAEQPDDGATVPDERDPAEPAHDDAAEDSTDPESWLEETDRTERLAARTHPPIERRVERLVEHAG